RMRGLDPHLLEVLVFQHNVTAALVFEALYDLVAWNFLRVRFRHLFVSDGTEIAGTKLPETKFLLTRGRINRHRNINQSEADAAFPDGTHESGFSLFHSTLRLSTTHCLGSTHPNLPCKLEKRSDVESCYELAG